MKKVLAMLVVFSIGSVAMADLSVDIVADTDADLAAAGLKAWDVYIRGTSSDDVMTSWDGGLKGDLHQAWGFAFGSWASSVWSDGFTASKYDTHMALTLSETVPVRAPEEDFDQNSPPKVDKGMGLFWSMGSYFQETADTSMAFGIKPASQALDLHFMRIVMPSSGVCTLKGTAVAKSGFGTAVDETIPEPATMGLLMVGAIGALIRRRR